MEEDALKQIYKADELAQIIFDTAPIGCCIFDKELNIFDCNQEMVNMFGLPNKQMFLEMYYMFSPDCQPCGKKSDEMMAEENSKTFKTGHNRFEWMHQRLNGESLPCEITQVRVIYKNEYAIAGYIRDLREHKELLDKINEENERAKLIVRQQAQAEAASNAKTVYLATMSHELRMPMNAIMGMANIGKNTADVERKNYALDIIRDSSRNLLNVINDVLDISRIEANKLVFSIVVFSLGESIQKAVSIVQFNMEEKQILFSINIDSKMPSHFLGDDQRVTQIITNLLSNAVKFSPKEGKIELSVSSLGEEDGVCELCFEVANSGIGISTEQHEKIIRLFEQAETGTTRRFGGSGIDLVVTKRIIELMGGRIWVESELGKGARFVFTLKLSRDDHGFHLLRPPSGIIEQNKASIEEIHKKFHGKKLLIVEDLNINREIILSLLADSGLVMDMAENGKVAFDMVAADPDKYDLIFMDIQMPVMDGLEATRNIRSLPVIRERRLPIIALTANVFQDDIDNCYLAGMDDHIGEPLELSEVLEKLNEYLI
jgi:PAS domain S-box-containing protein